MQPRRLAFPVLAILLGLVGGATLVEIGLRISGTTPDTVLRMTYVPSGPFENIQEPPFYRYKKNFEGNQLYFACDGEDCAPDMELSFHTSSMRMRGLTHSVENPDDNWRLMILGDSFAVADGVPELAAWPPGPRARREHPPGDRVARWVACCRISKRASRSKLQS